MEITDLHDFDFPKAGANPRPSTPVMKTPLPDSCDIEDSPKRKQARHKPEISLDRLLMDMMERQASDLYLACNAAPKFSVHGEFVDAADVELSPLDTYAYANEIMSPSQQEEFLHEMELNLSYALGEDGRFRVNIYMQNGTVALVLRRIETTIPRLDTLLLPERLGELVCRERGLLLVTGATGSGKSTTLASMIDYRNDRKGGHIITIEDPVEFMHKNKKALISQRQVGIDTKTFHIALKNTLRQAPKVIYIGEIRDQDTMQFALHASETGHLVLATLHSNNANQTFERIMNFFSHDQHQQMLLQLSLSLVAILSQRLIPKIGGGRVPALEILLNTPYISELIFKGDIPAMKTAMSAAKQEGCQTFDQDILRIWEKKLCTSEDALAFADSPNNLRLAMRGIGAATAM